MKITTVHPGGQLSRHVPEPLFVPTRAERGRIGLLEGVGGGGGGGRGGGAGEVLVSILLWHENSHR
jgi:hypothetical protein